MVPLTLRHRGIYHAVLLLMKKVGDFNCKCKYLLVMLGYWTHRAVMFTITYMILRLVVYEATMEEVFYLNRRVRMRLASKGPRKGQLPRAGERGIQKPVLGPVVGSRGNFPL